MKILSDESGIIVEEAYNPITFRAKNGMEIAICERDHGFEICHPGDGIKQLSSRLISIQKEKPTI